MSRLGAFGAPDFLFAGLRMPPPFEVERLYVRPWHATYELHHERAPLVFERPRPHFLRMQGSDMLVVACANAARRTACPSERLDDAPKCGKCHAILLGGSRSK